MADNITFGIEPVDAAKMFLLMRRNDDRDVNVLADVFREFAKSGIVSALKVAKEEFRKSSDASGGCHLMSDAECNCFLCRIDKRLDEF